LTPLEPFTAWLRALLWVLPSEPVRLWLPGLLVKPDGPLLRVRLCEPFWLWLWLWLWECKGKWPLEIAIVWPPNEIFVEWLPALLCEPIGTCVLELFL
jgi:hypothetical protein